MQTRSSVRFGIGLFAFIAHFVVAWVGVTGIESAVAVVLKLVTRSPGSIIAREWICSILLAALLGYSMPRRWRSSTAQWVWIPALLWFFYGISGVDYDIGEPLLTFTGLACIKGYKHYCQQFWLFSVPLIRTSVYSFAAHRAQTTSSNGIVSDVVLAGFGFLPRIDKESPKHPEISNPLPSPTAGETVDHRFRQPDQKD